MAEETVGGTDATLADLLTRVEAAVAAAEEANRKANSESGFAYNAKQNAEEHAKAIAQIRGTVEADSNWLDTTKKNVTEAAESVALSKKAAESDASRTLETRTSVEQIAAAVAALQDKVNTMFTVVDKARESVSTDAKRVTDDATATTAARANAEAASTAVLALQVQVADAAAKTQAEASAITVKGSETTSLLKTMVKTTETARATQERVDAYEASLKGLEVGMQELRSKIESLLPGATSAGLASAFRDQKARFNGPQKIWFRTFVVSIVLLFLVGSVGVVERFFDPATLPLTWDLVRLRIVYRLPVIVPLVWLALYAGRNYMLSLRLQEDYAYKEAVSTAFEGYRREMAGMPLHDNQLIPILALCENVLKTLGQRPGRLYDGKHEDVTPLTPLRSLLKDFGGKASPTPE